MSEGLPVEPSRRAMLLLLAAAASTPLAACGTAELLPSPALVEGPPIRVGERVYLLTNQWRDRTLPRSGDRYRAHGQLLTDVWAFDARTARPLWRVRLAEEIAGQNMGRAILGAHGQTLWVLQAKGLVALSLADGSRLGGAKEIAAAKPGLEPPIEPDAYAFDGAGLTFDAGGRRWRLGPDLKAVEATSSPPEPLPSAVAPAEIAGGVGTGAFTMPYARLEPRWIGLLDEASGQTMRRDGWEGWFKPEDHPRTKLWAGGFTRGRVGGDLAPLPQSPDFLAAGLLFDGRRLDGARPFLFPDASGGDSVLVLHARELRAQAPLRLSRVSTATGAALWTTDLPSFAIESVMPGEGSIVLLGRRHEEGLPMGPNDVQPISAQQLLAVDLATGKLGAYGLYVKGTDADDIPPSPLAPIR